jgi:hypothetical protein
MLEKISVFVFIFSTLFLIKEAYLFIQQILKNKEIVDEVVPPYKVSFIRLLSIGLSFSYFLTCLIKGF